MLHDCIQDLEAQYHRPTNKYGIFSEDVDATGCEFLNMDERIYHEGKKRVSTFIIESRKLTRGMFVK